MNNTSNNLSFDQRIQACANKPCPSDFPEKLKPYWDSGLKYSLTPLQSGWIQYYADLEKKKKVNSNQSKSKF